MSAKVKVFRKDAQPGDWADHKSGQLDPRQVTRINSRSVYLDAYGAEIGPCPASNYTYWRELKPEGQK